MTPIRDKAPAYQHHVPRSPAVKDFGLHSELHIFVLIQNGEPQKQKVQLLMYRCSQLERIRPKYHGRDYKSTTEGMTKLQRRVPK